MRKIVLFIALTYSLMAASTIEVISKDCVNVTTYKITEAIKAKKGFGVFSVIDHKKNAAKVGMKMKESRVIIFGNPKAGTVLMKQNPAIAYELPLKIAVFKNDKDETVVSYRAVKFLEQEYGLQGNPILPKMKKLLHYLSHLSAK